MVDVMVCDAEAIGEDECVGVGVGGGVIVRVSVLVSVRTSDICIVNDDDKMMMLGVTESVSDKADVMDFVVVSDVVSDAVTLFIGDGLWALRLIVTV